MRFRQDASRGFTLAELITVIAIIGLLSAMALPVAKFGYKRQKEMELRQRIRTITDAIDRYHDLRVRGLIKDPPAVGQEDYPKDLEELVKGVELIDGKKVKFIRERDLVDPITNSKEWDTRSSTDAFDALSSDDNNVFDIHSKSTQMSLDGKTHYNEW